MDRSSALALLVATGCYNPEIHPGSPCTTNTGCPRELSCIDGKCVVPGAPGDGQPPGDGTKPIDAAHPPDGAGACANYDLGSTLGAVATGTTVGHPDSYMSCNGGFAPDVSYAWTAPATAQFTIDLCASATSTSSFDSVLSVRDGSCTGTELACDDDGCATSFLSRTHVSLTTGQLVVIIVDGLHDQGSYTLTIQQN